MLERFLWPPVHSFENSTRQTAISFEGRELARKPGENYFGVSYRPVVQGLIYLSCDTDQVTSIVIWMGKLIAHFLFLGPRLSRLRLLRSRALRIPFRLPLV